MTGPSAYCAKFVLRATLVTVALLGIVFLICAAIDPYGLFGLSITDTLNGRHTTLHHQERLAKAYAIARLKPQAIILGNSRQGHALDPTHAGFAAGQSVTYNSSFDGAHIAEIYAYLKHAVAVGQTRRVVLGLDFSSFGAFKPQPAFRPELLDDDGEHHGLRRLIARVRIYTTADALLDSVASFKERAKPSLWDVDKGIRTNQAFEDRLRACGGVRENFRIREARDIRLNVIGGQTDQAVDQSLEIYRELLRFAHRHAIDLRLFVSPTHARSLVLLAGTGKLDAFVRWKNRLASINLQEGKASSSGQAFAFVDFSGVNTITSEPVPSKESGGTTMPWYWELSHYKRQTGTLILDRLFAFHSPGLDLPADFGRAPMGDGQFENLDAEVLSYESTHAEEVSDLKATLKSKGAYQSPPGCGVL